jgi:glycosyltransferase involved in cell wall biosynthesis
MHIGIDGSRCNLDKTTGVERYSLLVLPPLIRELHSRGHKVTVYAREKSELFAGATVRVSKLNYLWSHLFLGPKAQLDGVDCLFVPSHVLPVCRPKRSVLFVHDVCFENYPQAYVFWERWYLRLTTGNAARNAKIITHSNATKNIIKNIFGAKNVFGVNPAAIPVTNNESQTGWRKPYILFIGRVETKKNIRLLLEAFELLLAKHPEIKHDLVLLGKDGYGAAEIRKFHGSLRRKNRIIFFGYVPDNLRDQALREASGVVLPSLCEGSSLVLLEARTTRVPFAASACTVCKEAGGDMGIYVTKNDVANWYRALERLIFSPATPAPAPSRNWQDVAREIAEIITT